jgi:mono/diheme cytochrome c family protein
MMSQPKKPWEVGLVRRVAPAIGLLVGLAPVLAQAQTNIDQGKSPAEIFSTDCATCHKSARGLANGRGSLGLASFLAEHYTSSRDQAAALAAYVMGAGGGEPAPAARGPKPAADRNRASAEEPKPGAQPARTPGRADQAPPASAKLRPSDDEAKRPPAGIPTIMQEPAAGTPDRRPAAGRHETPPATANRNRRKEPETTPSAQQPAAVVAEPASAVPLAQDTGPVAAPAQSAAVPANADAGENAPVPRDNIPD